MLMNTVTIYEIMCTLNSNMVETEMVFHNMAGYLEDIRQKQANDETIAILATGTVIKNGESWKFRLPAMRDALGYTGEPRLRFIEDENAFNPMDPNYILWYIFGEEKPEIAEEFLEFLCGLTKDENTGSEET